MDEHAQAHQPGGNEPPGQSTLIQVAREDGRRQQAQRDRQQIGKHPEGGIVDREVGPDVEQVEEDARGLPERPDPQDCRGEDDEPGDGRGRDEDVNLVRQRGVVTPEGPDDQLGERRGGGEDDALGVSRHEAGIIARRGPRLAQERAGDERAVVVKRMIVAPQRPAVGEAFPAPEPPPDGQAVKGGQCVCEQSARIGARASLQEHHPGHASLVSTGTGARRGPPPRRPRRPEESGRDRPWTIPPMGCLSVSHRPIATPCGNAARRIRTCNQGIQVHAPATHAKRVKSFSWKGL